jgi:hypothetical protein
VIESDMKNWILPGEKYPFMAKGLSQSGLAELFVNKWRSMRKPVALSLDQSKFDGHIGKELKQLENLCFKMMSKHPCFRAMLRVQEDPTYTAILGTFVKSFKQRFLCGRLSGDPQTGCGNTLLMAVVCHVIFKVRHETFANGDDTIILMELEDLESAIENVKLNSVFGLECRVEQIAYRLEDVEWCQSLLTETPLGWTWIRYPRRVLNTLFKNVEYTPKNWRALLKSIAYCEAVLNPGIPIISPICEYISKFNVRAKTKTRYVIDVVERVKNFENNTKPVYEVTQGMRNWFSDKYGVCPEEQMRIEAEMCRRICTLSAFNRKRLDWIGRVHPFEGEHTLI